MKMNFINIMPVYPDKIEFTVSEIRRQAKEAGLTKVALCLSFHPQGTPAKVNADRLIRAFRDVKDALGDDPCVELGVLFQSFLGHGWSGPVPLTEEPWQNIVKMDGTVSSRICPLDPGFREYVKYCAAETTRAGAKFLLVDDDFGIRYKECFCPLHIAEFNKAAGKNMTQQEVINMIETAPVDDPDVRLFSRLRGEVAVSLAKEIRAAIDSVNPKIRCAMCTPGNGHSFTNDVAVALSNRYVKPLVRVGNAIYGMENPLSYIWLFRLTEVIRYQMPDVEEFIDEADTFPQTYYSESAVVFHGHLVQAILSGLHGAKLWMQEFGTNCSEGSQLRYEKIFSENHALYDELLNTVQGIEWQGPASPLFRPSFEEGNHPVKCAGADDAPEWGNYIFGPFGIPYCNKGIGESKFTALMEGVLPRISDEQLREIFKGSVLIDASAAKVLTERGFADLMGVKTVDRKDFFFTSERKADSKDSIWTMWDKNAVCLEPVSDEVKVPYLFCNGITRVDAADPVSPAMTLFTNKLGGRVAVMGWSPVMPFYKMMRPKRREWLLEAIDFLNGGTLEMTVEVPHQVFVRHGKLKDGGELVTVMSLGIDPVDAIPLRCIRTVKEILQLKSNGTWEKVPFTQQNGLCTIGKKLLFCEPDIFRFTF